MAYKEIALGAFLDIEKAFVKTSFAVSEAAIQHRVGFTIVNWINTEVTEVRYL
jgi:hypothetical protein